MQKENDQWYASWFNTPYYHMLYKDRDYEEAGDFMNQLTSFLDLKPGHKILDLACGRGRHSVYLSRKGYDVTGIDLSLSNIESAKKYENELLHFKVHDMCIPYPETFDAVLNLFTSFGYFDSEEDNLRTIQAIKKELNPNGYGVIDFLNVNYVKQNLVSNEEKLSEGILFTINRKIENGYILKDIDFRVNGDAKKYTEKVKALTLTDFKQYFTQANINLKNVFGDYQLNKFDIDNSPRLILIFN